MSTAAIVVADEGEVPPVLLVEDNSVIAAIITEVLATVRLRVRRVSCGEAALEALLRDDFALVVIDANLPDLGGCEVTKRWRFAAIGRTRAPILGLASDPVYIEAFIEAGADACLAKPLDLRHFLETVASLVPIAFSASADATQATEPSGSSVSREAASIQAPGTPAPIDLAVLRDLEKLGGRQFVEDVMTQFVSDGARILPELGDALKNADVEVSRDLLHALRSCAANVGASAIFDYCLTWRAIEREELGLRADVHLTHLEAAFEEARRVIDEALADPSRIGGPSTEAKDAA
jgi:two-component system, sensor histidine kinase RpfC